MPLPSFSFGLATPETRQSEDRGIIGRAFVADESLGLIDLPGWLRIRCDTADRTAQQSATTAQSGYAAHAPRAFSRDGVTFGLLVEPAVSNLVQDPVDLTTWVNTVTVTSFVAPDGNSIPCELEDDDAGAVEFSVSNLTLAPPEPITTYTLSAWQYVSTLSAGASVIRNDRSSGADVPVISTGAVDADWVYRVNTDTTDGFVGGANLHIRPADTAAADTGITRVWGVQLEARDYPTSFAPPAAVDTLGVRAVEALEAVAAAVLPDGFLRVDMSYRPHYADDEASGDHNLFRLDDNNRVFYREADDVLVFRWNGDDLVSAPISFARHDTITLFFENSAVRRRLIVNGVRVDGTLQPKIEGLDLPTFATILGGASGAEEGADLLTFDPNITTFCELADARVLVQMGDAPGNRNFRDLMCTLSIQPAIYFDVCTGVKAGLELETAIGAQLDLIGAIVGLAREGFTDDRYRVFLTIQTELLLSASRDGAEWIGTIPNILRIARAFITDAVGGTITYTPILPYGFKLDLPVVLPVNEILLLFRFLQTAVYAAVLGLFEFPLDGDTWGSASVVVATAGTWGSASVVVAGASTWDLVVTTQ